MKTKLPFVFLFAFGIMLASPLTETTKIVQGQVVKVTEVVRVDWTNFAGI